MAGDIYKIESGGDGMLQAKQLPATEMSSVDALNMSYGVSVELEAAGVSFARGEIAPGKEVPAHSGPNLYGLYIISGTGRLTLADRDGKVTSDIAYKPDDLIVFEPGAMHGWKNDGDAAMKWLGVDISAR